MNTPTITSTPKRPPTSPLEELELKKNRSDSPIPAMALSSSTLTKDDITKITDSLHDTFEAKMASMVGAIVNGVLAGINKEVNSLREENKALRAKVCDLESRMDTAEQYSRRNCVRITGISEDSTESTDKIVLDMAKALKVNIGMADIDRSHRVGKPQPSKRRAIIVKFATYRARQTFYKARAKAKDTGYRGVYINEDLTKSRNATLYEARCLVKTKRINGAWTSDGTILIKDKNDSIIRINTPEDLERFRSA